MIIQTNQFIGVSAETPYNAYLSSAEQYFLPATIYLLLFF